MQKESNETTAKSGMLEIHTHIAGVSKRVLNVCAALMDRAVTHDASKYSEKELDAHLAKIIDANGITYGTDAYYKINKKYEALRAEHFANNRHHPEHHPNGIDDMDLVDVIEMLCDWLMASENTGTAVERSLAINEQRYNISPQVMQLLRNTIRNLNLDREN